MASLLNMSGGNLLNKGLPYDAEIEYLESSGTQYIRVDKFVSEPNLEISIQKNSNSEGALYSTAGYSLGRDYLGVSSTSLSWLGGSSSVSIYDTLKNQKNYDINIYGTKAYVYEDGVVVTNGMDIVRGASWYAVRLLSTGSGRFLSTRLKTVKIYTSNNVLVYDLIPVRKGNVGYMYDKVSKQLFGNSGTGAFILGNDI